MFPELSLCVNRQKSEYPFNEDAYESDYSKIDESGNIYESGKISDFLLNPDILSARELLSLR